jgi:hypothetical protein
MDSTVKVGPIPGESDPKDAAQERLTKLKESFKLGTYQHYKGPYYTVYALSIKEDTCDVLVHYSHDHKTQWTRTFEDFTTAVEGHGKRFKYVREAHPIQLLRAAGFDSMVDGFQALGDAWQFLREIRGA